MCEENLEAFDLMPESLASTIPALGATANLSGKDITARTKFFCPYGAYTFYVVEYDSINRIAFGFATVFGDIWEFGTVSIEELESLEHSHIKGLKLIERDIYFTPDKLGSLVPEAF